MTAIYDITTAGTWLRHRMSGNERFRKAVGHSGD